MTQIEQVKAEIERRRVKYKELISKSFGVEQEYFKGMGVVADEMMLFINSLPAEQPSEDLEKEVDKQWNEEYRPYDSGYTIAELSLSDYKETARHFAQWQKEQMLKSAFDGEITKFFDCNLSVKAQLPKDSKCCFGDKVKVIIVKKDKQ